MRKLKQKKKKKEISSGLFLIILRIDFIVQYIHQ